MRIMDFHLSLFGDEENGQDRNILKGNAVGGIKKKKTNY